MKIIYDIIIDGQAQHYRRYLSYFAFVSFKKDGWLIFVILRERFLLNFYIYRFILTPHLLSDMSEHLMMIFLFAEYHIRHAIFIGHIYIISLIYLGVASCFPLHASPRRRQYTIFDCQLPCRAPPELPVWKISASVTASILISCS